MFFAFALLLSLSALSEDSKLDSTFRRTNSFCKIDGEKFEFSIRGDQETIEPQDAQWGQWIFIEGKELVRFENFPFRVRAYPKSSKYCTKTSLFKIDKNKYAHLYLKDNRPSQETLLIQVYNSKEKKSENFIDTNLEADDVQEYKDGFSFEASLNSHSSYLHKTSFEDRTYIIQSRAFKQQMYYSKDGLVVDEELSFERSPWKIGFNNLKEFLERTSWDETERKFQKTWAYLAISHSGKKRCMLFSNTEVRPTTIDSSWLCI